MFDESPLEPDQVLYERRISARKRGTLALIAAVALTGGILGATHWIFDRWAQDWLLLLLVVLVGGLTIIFSVIDLIRGGQWHCRLTRRSLRCGFPSVSDGEDFELPVERVAAFIKRIDFYKRSSETHYLIEDVQGQRYRIDKRHLSKPARFAEQLRAAGEHIDYREESRDLTPT